MLKALKKMFGKAEDEQPQPAPSPAVAPAQSRGADDKRPRKNKPARPASETVSDSPAPQQPRPPKAEKPRRERPAKPVDNWKLEDFVVEPAEGKTRFHDFKLAPELMHAIHDLGFPYCCLLYTSRCV